MLLFICAIRIYLGIIFLFSAGSKIIDIKSFAGGVRAYNIIYNPIIIAFVAASIISLELIIGISSLFSLQLSIVIFFMITMLLIFNLAMVINLAKGNIIRCSCHGAKGNSTISWGSVCRNTMLIMMGILVAYPVYAEYKIFNFSSYNYIYIILVIFYIATLHIITKMLELNIDLYISIKVLEGI
jgi:hypothetical protein